MAASVPPTATASTEDSLTLFAALWAVAAIFHVLANDWSAQSFSDPTALGLSHVFLAICAVWLLVRPKADLPLLLVAILGPVTAWQEAPILGNHWLLVALVDLALLSSAVIAFRNGNIDRDRLAEVFLPLARWCLVLFYCFAAFSKLNSAFFDTAVSCSTYYFDETVHSLGFGTVLTVGAGGLARLLPFLVSATELSIPVLLANRRTQVCGVLLGLGFHSLVSLDRQHLFVDFSAVLAALFILFLPGQFASSALKFLRGKGRWLVICWVALAGVVLIALWIGANSVTSVLFPGGRLLIWYLFDVILLWGVVSWLRAHWGRVLERPFRLRGSVPLWLTVVPALVVLNGLLPYVELRTAYGFTMYSNLAMVEGRSNHLIVRSSLPIGGRQASLVKILASNDPGLKLYAINNYLLPWDSFRAYLAEHPGVAIAYERGGRDYVFYRASDDPELVRAPSVLVQKLFAMRAVDGGSAPRCQDAFLPAL